MRCHQFQMMFFAFWTNSYVNAVLFSDGHIHWHPHFGGWCWQIEFFKQSFQPFGSAVVLQISVVTDAYISIRQNVLLKPSDKFINTDAHFFVFGFGAAVAIVFIFELHIVLFLIYFQYSMWRNGCFTCPLKNYIRFLYNF